MAIFDRVLRTRRVALTGAVFAPLASIAFVVHAEDQDTSTLLEPIVVSAQKRPEDLQEVPVAISVLGQTELERVSASSSNADLARQVPNFNYMASGGQYSNSGNIRGVGSFSPLSPNDTSISYNIDDVPLSAYGIQPSTLDMSRVEVLRGPQGTLYGLNAQGGAINFIPNRPVFGHELSVATEFGTNGWRSGEITANETLIDDILAGRLALRYNQRAGDVANAGVGGDDGKRKIGSARGSLLLTPDGDTDILFSLNYNRSDDSQPRFIQRDAPCFPCDGLNPRPNFQREDFSGNLRIEHSFDTFRITSISSIQKNSCEQDLDLTDSLIFSKLLGIPRAGLEVDGEDAYFGKIDESRYYQEFRLSSFEDEPVAWTAGVNAFRSSSSVHTRGENFTLPNFSAFSGRQDNDLSVTSYSAFGDLSVPIIGKLRALGGARLTSLDANAHYRYTGAGLPGTVSDYEQTSKFSDTFITGHLGLSYAWTPDLMTYVTVGRGAVGGGYPWNGSNLPAGRAEPYFPTSTSWSYEAGFKSMLFDGQASINGSIFSNNVRDGHLYVFNRSLLTYQTAALDFDTYGAELEARFQVTPEFSLQANVGYTHAELKNVALTSPTGAKSGNKVPNVPEITAMIAGEYRIDSEQVGISEGELYLNGAYQFVDRRAADVGNNYDLDAYGIVNLRMGWDGDRTRVYAFANNVFDKRYEAVGTYYGPGVEAVTVGQGRTIGMGINVKF